MNLRNLCITALTGAVLISATAASWAASSVGFISLVRGRPVLQDPGGPRQAMRLMQGLVPGTVLTLDSNDAVGVCHEPAATSYRIEGAGTVRVEPDRIVTQSGDAKVLTVGRCGATANSSETGGVLLRSVKTPK